MRIAPCADAGFGGGGGGGHGGRAGVLVWGFREGRGGRWFEVESDGCETGAARAESLSVVSSWLIASGGVVGWCLQRGFFLEAGLLRPFKNCLLLLYNRMKALLYSRDDCSGHGSLVDSGGCGGTIISRLHCLPGFHLLINTTHSNLSTAFAFTFASTSQQYTAYVPKLLLILHSYLVQSPYSTATSRISLTPSPPPPSFPTQQPPPTNPTLLPIHTRLHLQPPQPIPLPIHPHPPHRPQRPLQWHKPATSAAAAAIPPAPPSSHRPSPPRSCTTCSAPTPPSPVCASPARPDSGPASRKTASTTGQALTLSWHT